LLFEADDAQLCGSGRGYDALHKLICLRKERSMWLMKPAFFDVHLSAMQHEAELKEGYANAIYSDRVRTLPPARRVETLILWNFPSQLPGLATGENGEPSERKTKSALTYE